jgi:hypothetical protein
MPAGPLGRVGRRLAIIVMLLAIGLASVALANTNAFRYASLGNSSNCFYRLSERLPHAETIILGSSRLRRGIDPDHLGQLLSEDPQRIINFGMPRRSTARTLFIIQKLVAEAPRPPKRLVVEANRILWLADGTKYADYGYKPGFAAFASVGALIDDAGTKQNQSYVLRVRDFFEHLMTKLETAAAVIAHGRLVRTMFIPSNKFDKKRKNICFNNNFDENQTRKDILKQEIAKKSFFAEHENWFEFGYSNYQDIYEEPMLSREIYYMGKIVELANRHDISVSDSKRTH